MYSVDPVDNKMGLQLICFDKNFSKKSIVQIEVVPQYKLLFSLTDGLIMVHSISTYNFIHLHTALETKGATVFCVNVEVRIIFLSIFFFKLIFIVYRNLNH